MISGERLRDNRILSFNAIQHGTSRITHLNPHRL